MAHPFGRRYRDSCRAQGPPQLAVLGAVAEKLFLRRIGLIAIPAVLINGLMHSRAILLKLILELFEPVELLLLRSGRLGRCLRGVGLSRIPRSRPARK